MLSLSKHRSYLFHGLSNGRASIDFGEEPGRRAFGPFNFVKRSKEPPPPARQQSKVCDPFHDHDSRAKNHAVHREIFGGKIRKPSAVLLEEIEADRFGILGYEPLGGLRREERR